MKILLLNISGRFGSTGKIVNDLRESLLMKGHEVIVVYGHVDIVEDEGFIQIGKPLEAKIFSQFVKLGRPMYKGNPFAFRRLKKVIDYFGPDIVHVHCINGLFCNIYRLFEYLAFNSIKTVITHHAEFFYTGSCGHSFDCLKYSSSQCLDCEKKIKSTGNLFWADPNRAWWRMYEIIQLFNYNNLIFTSVSPWVEKKALLSPIVNKYRHYVVMNGIHTDIFFRYNSYDSFIELVNKRLDLRANAKKVLHVTHEFSANDTDHIKGGGYVTLLAKCLPQLEFIVVASVLIDTTNLPSNLHIWGTAESSSELSQLYGASDISIIASKRETFSMIVAESLCCGTPIAGFKAGGPETIALSDYGRFVEYGDVGAFKESILELLNSNFDRNCISELAREQYSKERMSEDFVRIYSVLLSSNEPQ